MIYTHAAAFLIGMAVAGAGAWQVQNWRADAREKQRLEALHRDMRAAEKQIDSAAAGHEADKRHIEVEYREITKEVERVVEKPVYRNVCLDADGLRVLADAIAPGAAASEPARAVPGSGATR